MKTGGLKNCKKSKKAIPLKLGEEKTIKKNF